jgi:hypothetical protein
MASLYYHRFLLISLGLCLPLSASEHPFLDAERIGKEIFQNECSGKTDRLVWWNDGENFASLGIGHFIWYPKDIKGPFEETFPMLLSFLKEKNAALPQWLDGAGPCPWNTREELFARSNEPKRKELQELLLRTISLQAAFIENRLEEAMPRILDCISVEKRSQAEKKIAQLKSVPQGKFALIDYLNFKGDGTLSTEQYNGKGWGLKQVLEEMQDNPDNALEEFIKTAKLLLEQRVRASPPERHEEKWLPGWLARVDRYKKSLN